jgi:dethiobiotin synthetase
VRGCFVTGTDTGVGKTVLAAAIVAALRATGATVRVRKPLITGLEDIPDPDWPHDHQLLASAAGCRADEVAVRTFGPAVSPHLALELAGEGLDLEELAGTVRAAGSGADALIVEGVGGLLVPLDWQCSVRDLARELTLPLVIAARPGLGTINHTLLTLEAARAASLPVAGVALTPWPATPGVIERSNLATIERLGEVSVATLPWIPSATPELLAGAGAGLPLDEWLV